MAEDPKCAKLREKIEQIAQQARKTELRGHRLVNIMTEKRPPTPDQASCSCCCC
jgi:hypothetical protein